MALRPVVITGLGVICAIGRDPVEFWARLTSGESGITPISDGAYAAFDARFAGQVPTEWITDQLPEGDADLDRTAQLALVAARQAVQGAGLETDVASDRFGIVLGKCQATPDAEGRYQPMHRTGDVVAGKLGALGPRILVSTACAAGGNAVGLARDKILTGEADVVLAGGVDPLLFGTYAGFAGLQALSNNPCRPYSTSDGLNLGEGAAFLVVEPLDRVLARGGTPLAEVAGYGLSADAYHATAPDPTGRGGVSAMRRAFADAGMTADDVSYVSGHGTGTPANDSMEIKVMRTVFGERAGAVPTSSIKSFLGHTLGAAGAVEAVASVLALQNSTAPPTIGFDEPAEQAAPADNAESGPIPLDFVPNAARSFPIDTVVSNNYAFGGNNVSLVLTTPRGEREYEELPKKSVVISGIGPVSGLGIGVADLAEAIANGRQAPGEVPSLTGRTFAPRSLWRHMNDLSRLAIAASRLAWEDAALKLPRAAMEDIGVMFATAQGSVESTGGFDESVAANPNKPSVLSFSNVVLNATGGAVCQTLGLRGPTTTICNGGASASIALDCAVETIRAGKAEVVLVVAADETDRPAPDAPGTTPYGQDHAAPIPGSGAVAFVVESAEHCQARGGTAYAEILETRHAAGDGAESDTEMIKRSLDGLATGEVGLVVGAGVGGSADADEAAVLFDAVPGGLLTSPIGHTGDCQSASGAMNLAVAAMAVRDGVAPALTELTSPRFGAVDRYVTKPEMVGTVTSALALTAAPGSVRGTILLGKP
ncbi:beta-ketoacyl-[acyl-carrier-protein] synthase family protein [Actinoalloteichus hymeniacidonis]|uniref:3-oxoacyl-(Acyl-carrier-protein) synthase n=1 Tax=Actinoalloteichus hymeniacidonis TaxID=340345 RepID=A0AAC9MX73_9PSEU|nr:beta-ketoacyl-[acyl-carrier-protein] synthase family protein [Actinoalloteichus hymeniacidonis]AOS61964.1 3-oxoacyl-(acyl-carrier-protein) synthase [Actinoalloteichus hymeniacidonis]MBB5910014.1 3-oxoacyl-[acyl-carrier-protein] synthase II [Actinoalloteichus hymeniacidonis]